MDQTFNPRYLEAETRGSKVQGQLEYLLRLFLKIKIKEDYNLLQSFTSTPEASTEKEKPSK